MELYQLRYFKVLAEEGNLTRAAKALYISPPALSSAIVNLEKDLQTQLFDRVKGRMYLNENGRIFLESVRQSLSILDSYVSTQQSAAGNQKKSLSIGTTNASLWNEMLCLFLLENPDVHLRHSNHDTGLYRKTSNLASYDFILCPEGELRNPELDHLVLLKAVPRVSILVSRSHPFAGRKTVEMKELAGEKFIFPSRHLPVTAEYYKLCRNAGFEPDVLAECAIRLQLYLFQKGLGIMFCSSLLPPENAPESVIIPIADAASLKEQAYAVYWRKNTEPSEAAQKFLDFSIRYAKELSDKIKSTII